MRTAALLLAFGALVPALHAAGPVPRPAPEYAAKLPEGGQMLLSKYRGKVVAVEFVLTTCGHCQQAARTLQKLQTELGPRGLQVVAVTIDEPPKIAEFRQITGAKFPIAISSRDPAAEFLQLSLMDRMNMPQMVFIDRAGVIQSYYPGESPFFGPDQEKSMRAEIEKLLSAPAAKKPAPARRVPSKVS